MKYFLSFLLISSAQAAEIPVIPFPVFLKIGFSSVLEFETPPAKVVVGDATNFQVEKLDKSLIVRTLTPYGVSNMFVYLASGEVKLFTLTASDDAVPTHFRAFKNEQVKPLKPAALPTIIYKKGTRIISARFDAKKDFLTIEVLLTADSKTSFTPRWDWVDLRYKNDVFKPHSLWAERKTVQKDSTVKARFVFLRPNISKNFSGSYLQIPIENLASPMRLQLIGGTK